MTEEGLSKAFAIGLSGALFLIGVYGACHFGIPAAAANQISVSAMFCAGSAAYAVVHGVTAALSNER